MNPISRSTLLGLTLGVLLGLTIHGCGGSEPLPGGCGDGLVLVGGTCQPFCDAAEQCSYPQHCDLSVNACVGTYGE